MPIKKSKGTSKSKKKGKIRKCFNDFVVIFSCIAVGLLWLSAGSVYINPCHFRYLSIVGLAFPFFVVGVIASLLICLLFARKKIWIPLLGLAVAFMSIRSYCPVNFPAAHPKNCYKIVSYNTLGFATSSRDSAKEEGLLNYIERSGIDFFCYQEGNCTPPKLLNTKIIPRLRKTFRFNDTITMGANALGCSTNFPIIKKEVICNNGMNGAAVFHIVMKGKDTIRIINCHLQSMGLSSDDRKQYHEMVRHLNDSNAEGHSRLLISKISKAGVLRANQADAVAQYIEKNQDKNLIVCGDFNDTPISYSHHRILSTGLTDAYQATANGIGRSFNRDAIYVRIDHLFCSKHWEPYGFHIDNSIESSDHYPLVGYLQKKRPEDIEQSTNENS